MSHNFELEPHEKAMIDVILKSNTTPEWIYEFNKFLIEERTTGEIIKFIDELLYQELQKAREHRKGWKGYVAVDPLADNYKYSPVFSDRKGAELWVKGKEINGLGVVEVDILLADQSELDQPTV